MRQDNSNNNDNTLGRFPCLYQRVPHLKAGYTVHSLPRGGGCSGRSRVVASSPEGSSILPAPSLAPAATSTAVAPSGTQESTASASLIRPPTPCLCCSHSRQGCRI